MCTHPAEADGPIRQLKLQASVPSSSGELTISARISLAKWLASIHFFLADRSLRLIHERADLVPALSMQRPSTREHIQNLCLQRLIHSWTTQDAFARRNALI